MITKKKIRRYQRIIIGLSLILSLISTCSRAPLIEKVIENNPEPEPTETLVVSTETEEIIDEPTPTLDVSRWIVKIGEMGCVIEPLGYEQSGWYMAVCPEELWLPIGQTSTVEVIVDDVSCDLKSVEALEEITQEYFPDSLQLEFVEMEDGSWGCQIPYSDTAGIDVVCGFVCEEEEIGIIISGKTIRNYIRGDGGRDDNSGSSGKQPPPQPTWDPND